MNGRKAMILLESGHVVQKEFRGINPGLRKRPAIAGISKGDDDVVELVGFVG
jgi:hypothetical protein